MAGCGIAFLLKMNWRRNYDFETRNGERLSWLNVRLVMITEGTGYYQTKASLSKSFIKGT
jgi:hypothetical protein